MFDIILIIFNFSLSQLPAFFIGLFVGFFLHKEYFNNKNAKIYGTYNCHFEKKGSALLLDNGKIAKITCPYYQKRKLLKKHCCKLKNKKCIFYN